MDNKGKILIIDDNPKNIQVLASILNENGYDSEFALNGTSGLNWLETEAFDLVLLDVMMPEEDGFEVCKTIRSSKLFEDLPIIFVTAKVERESLVYGFEVGGDDYIIKPFDTRELLARVKNQIELKRNRQLLVELNNNLAAKVEEKTSKLIEAYKELEQTNQNLIRLNNDLKKLEQSKQQFLDLIGREMIGAINEVTSIFQVIKYKVDSKKVGELIDDIDKALSKVESFVSTAIRITKLQSNNPDLVFTQVELQKIIGFSLLKLDDKIRRKSIKFNVNKTSETVFIYGENLLLTSCFISVFDFLLERNPANSTIQIETEARNNEVFVKVFDNGPEIDNNHIDELFDLFSANKHTLKIAKIITEIHGGSITVSKINPEGVEINLKFYANNYAQEQLK